MIDPDKKTLFLEVLSKTGGLYDPKIIKKFIEILEEWLPPADKIGVSDDQSDKNYKQGWNAYKSTILENLK